MCDFQHVELSHWFSVEHVQPVQTLTNSVLLTCCFRPELIIACCNYWAGICWG